MNTKLIQRENSPNYAELLANATVILFGALVAVGVWLAMP